MPSITLSLAFLLSIAPIGLPALPIVSFFDDCYRKKAYVGKVPNVPDGYLMGEGHGVYLTAAYGKFVSLSVGESEFLRIDENFINIYEETLVGTWIDGKPLYRKVFTGLILRYSDSFGSGNMTNPDGTKVSLSGDVDVSSVIFLDCYYVDSKVQFTRDYTR